MLGSRNAARRRSDQSESGEAPVKTRARIAQLPSAFVGHPPLNHYVSSALSQLPLQNSPTLPSFLVASPPSSAPFSLTLPSRDRTLTSPSRGSFPLPHPPPSPDSSRHQSRRSNRSTAPYSAACRPRSAGGLSQRSWKDDESDSSVTSSTSGKHFARERSAPLPSIWSPTLLSSDPLSFPLSLYPLHPSPPLPTTISSKHTEPASFQSFSMQPPLSSLPPPPHERISPLERRPSTAPARDRLVEAPATYLFSTTSGDPAAQAYGPMLVMETVRRKEGRWAFLKRGIGRA